MIVSKERAGELALSETGRKREKTKLKDENKTGTISVQAKHEMWTELRHQRAQQDDLTTDSTREETK